MSLRQLFVTSVVIQYPTDTRGTEGGQSRTWTTRHATMPCRIQPLSAREAVLYGRETEKITHRLYCDPAYTVEIEDRITYDSRTFLVKGVRNTDELDRLQVVELEETN